MVSTSLCRKYTCPPRLSSRSTASRITPLSSLRKKVLIDKRRCGAVAMTLKSRKPSSASPSVRGMGVAVRVSTSTSARNCFIASLWRTPKRCSSSMMSRPRFLNRVFSLSSLCVPTTISTVPASMPASAALISFCERKRLISATCTGHLAKRSLSVWQCCSASKVVGAKNATCLPPVMATKAARKATSVLPKPTSPQTNLSIGRGETMSCMTALMAACWSAVSSKPKSLANTS